MEITEIFEKLKSKFGEKAVEIDTSIKEPFIKVSADKIIDVCKFLKADSELKFDYLMCLSGVDFGKNLGVMYHLWSFEKNHKVILKVEVSRHLAMVPSIVEIHPGANWHEREVYDLFGIKFPNHPDLSRILLTDDWEGYPLRKDYKFPKDYKGIPLD